MKKYIPILCLTLLVICGCNEPSIAPQTQKVELGDLLYSKDAPKKVRYKEIRIAHQPPPPPYPTEAREAGIQGDVLVEVWINEKGEPYKSGTIWGPKQLSKYAETYALRWRFVPFHENGTPIPIRFRFLVICRLTDGGILHALPKGVEY